MKAARLVGVLATAAVAATVGGALTACQPNAGAAAYVGSSRISESDVSALVLPTAVPSTDPSSGQVINPKTNALNLQILIHLFDDALQSTPGGPPSASQLNVARQNWLASQNATENDVQAAVRQGGYTVAYGRAVIDEGAKLAILETAFKDPGDNTAVVAALQKRNIQVRVSPRYGTWVPAMFAVNPGPTTPSFLQLGSSDTRAGLSG